MKRAVTHILFWIGYWALLEYSEYLWMKDFIPGWPLNKVVARSVMASILYGIPHLLLAYYLAYFAVPRIVRKKSAVLFNIAMIAVPYFIAICLVILIAHNIVLPYVYEGVVPPAQAFFDPAKFLTILIEVAFPAGLLMAIKLVNTELAAKEREKNLLKEKLSTELKLLKSQLNPHFLFNTLNNIYALSRKKSDAAPDVVLKLAELLSFMLYESGNDRIAVSREVKFLEDYISLQRIRYDNHLSVQFTRTIDDPLQPVAPLLLLPLIENAFKHGASENHFDSFIHIDLQVEKGKLNFIVENSFEEGSRNEQPSNIGLHNAGRQLEMIYSEQKMNINRENNIFKVALAINLNSYGKI